MGKIQVKMKVYSTELLKINQENDIYIQDISFI